jgi:hypothetical protein
MEPIGCVRFEKFNCNFYFAPVRTRVARAAIGGKFSHPKQKLRKRTKHEFWVKWCLGCVRFEKFNCNFYFTLVRTRVARMALGGKFSHPKQKLRKLRKRTKHEFWVKWSQLGAFVPKNSTATFISLQFALEWPERP